MLLPAAISGERPFFVFTGGNLIKVLFIIFPRNILADVFSNFHFSSNAVRPYEYSHAIQMFSSVSMTISERNGGIQAPVNIGIGLLNDLALSSENA